jgi:hypothetical protein
VVTVVERGKAPTVQLDGARFAERDVTNGERPTHPERAWHADLAPYFFTNPSTILE